MPGHGIVGGHAPEAADMPRAAAKQGGDELAVVSYNLWEGRAQQELSGLVAQQRPAVLCLQEATVRDLPERVGALELVVSTAANRLGVALYADAERFEVERSAAFSILRSLHDRLGGSTAQRLVGARLRERESGASLVVGSLHATPLTDPNIVRRWQIDEALQRLVSFGGRLPTVVAGDFNYPFWTDGLRRHLARRGYDLSRTPTSTYRRRRHGVVRGAFDLAASRGFETLDAVTLPQGVSDHSPIRVDFRYEAGTR